MTREETKEKIQILDYVETHKYDYVNEKQVIELVDFIYDDFESRTCENCKYSDCETEGTIICRHIDDEMPFHVPNDFGCNKFERKQDD